MEVKPGYKQTEVGVIPEDWEVKPLGSLTSLLTNGFVGTATNAYVDNEGGVLYIQGYNIQENGFNFHGIKRVSKLFHARNQKSCLQPGDLLTIQTGDIGVTAVVPPVLAGSNCHALVISRFDKRLSDPNFYCQYFNSEQGRVAFKEIETGSTMKHLNVGDMKRLFLPSPSVEEQRAIVEALSDEDALLESLEQLIVKKRHIKQGAMQELLTGKKRLPGFEVKPGYKRTEVGVIPDDWQVAPMGERFNISGGLSASRDQLGGNGHCYLHYGDIHTSSQTYIDVDKQRMDIPKLDVHLGDVPKRSILLDGDIVFVDASEDDEGTSKHQVVCNPRGIPFISGLHTIVAKSKRETFANSYKRHCFQTRLIKNQFRFYAVGTKVSGISKTNIAKILLPIPPLSEQTAIATILSDMDAEIAVLDAKLAKARQIKQGMMQELLTGRIRLI